MSSLYIVVNPTPDIPLPVMTVSTKIKSVRGTTFFDNGELKMAALGDTAFADVHRPLTRKLLNDWIAENKFDLLFPVFESLHMPDLPLIKGNYNDAKRHEAAGGNSANQFATIRIWFADQIDKLRL